MGGARRKSAPVPSAHEVEVEALRERIRKLPLDLSTSIELLLNKLISPYPSDPIALRRQLELVVLRVEMHLDRDKPLE